MSAATPKPLACVLRIEADLHLGVPAAALEHLDRVLSSFEAYCTVTQSIAQGPGRDPGLGRHRRAPPLATH